MKKFYNFQVKMKQAGQPVVTVTASHCVVDARGTLLFYDSPTIVVSSFAPGSWLSIVNQGEVNDA